MGDILTEMRGESDTEGVRTYGLVDRAEKSTINKVGSGD
jgi:hypothetical protein